MHIKKTLQLSGVILAGIAAWSWADAPAADTSAKPGVFEAAAMSLSGTVQAIDYTTRSVTLQKQDGTTVTFDVGPNATRFNEVKQGDVVRIDYLESVAVVVQAPDATVAAAVGSNSVVIRNKSKLPSGQAVQTDVVTATVVKVNAKKRIAVLKGPSGNEFTVDVAPDVQHLENVKVGDQVLVKFTRSLAVSVSKPTKS